MMGEPDRDIEEGLSSENALRPSICPGIFKRFVKAKTKAIETLDIKTPEDKLEYEMKKAEYKRAKDDLAKYRKNLKRLTKFEQQTKKKEKFKETATPEMHTKPRDTNIVGNITKLLPTNTFLLFQTLAPLSTNNGDCGRPEIIMTSIMLIILAFACMLVCFTDTIQVNNRVYPGLVTREGLWNPSFKSDPNFSTYRENWISMWKYLNNVALRQERKLKGEELRDLKKKPKKPTKSYLIGSTIASANHQYQLHSTDVLHAVLSAMAFATLTMLTSPVSTCFYPNIPNSVEKTLPLLIGFVISAIFAFTPPARNDIANPLPESSDLSPAGNDIATPLPESSKLSPAGNAGNDIANPSLESLESSPIGSHKKGSHKEGSKQKEANQLPHKDSDNLNLPDRKEKADVKNEAN